MAVTEVIVRECLFDLLVKIGVNLILFFFDDAMGVLELGLVLLMVASALGGCFGGNHAGHLFEKGVGSLYEN